MSEPFLAEIRIMGFNFAPRGWGMCDGQVLPIAQNQSLYSLLGTIYGGDGRTSFMLPDLRSRTPVHKGAPATGGTFAPTLGTKTGQETHTLTAAEIPAHTHTLHGTNNPANRSSPTNNLYATAASHRYVEQGSGTVTSLSPAAIGNMGGSQPHDNMQPFLTLNFCIAMQGLFPSRS